MSLKKLNIEKAAKAIEADLGESLPDIRQALVEASTCMKVGIAESEAELERVADVFMTDPDFAECRDDEKLWEVTVVFGRAN